MVKVITLNFFFKTVGIWVGDEDGHGLGLHHLWTNLSDGLVQLL